MAKIFSGNYLLIQILVLLMISFTKVQSDEAPGYQNSEMTSREQNREMPSHDHNSEMLHKIFEILAKNSDSIQKYEETKRIEIKIKENLLDRLKKLHFSEMKLR